jgi:hypothetical protein
MSRKGEAPRTCGTTFPSSSGPRLAYSGHGILGHARDKHPGSSGQACKSGRKKDLFQDATLRDLPRVNSPPCLTGLTSRLNIDHIRYRRFVSRAGARLIAGVSVGSNVFLQHGWRANARAGALPSPPNASKHPCTSMRRSRGTTTTGSPHRILN